MAIEVRVVPADAVLGLRHAVLRPHLRLEQVRFAADDAPLSTVFAALSDGEVVATATVHPEAPGAALAGIAPAGTRTWRLRAVATREDHRNQGLGGEVLDALCAHVVRAGGGLLWCTARARAVPFYLRHGFCAHGAPWTDPQTGPHVHMWRLLDPVAG